MTEHNLNIRPGITAYSKGCRCSDCKQAQSAYDKARYPREREQRMASARRWRENNVQLHKQQNAEWYQRNKEIVKARTAAWTRNNPERVAASKNARVEQIRSNARLWCKRNPEKVRAWVRKRKARKRQMQGSHTLQDWLAVLRKFNHQCGRCGTSENLTQDHIIPVTLNGTDNPDNLQPLCKSCNSWKHCQSICFLPPDREAP